MNDLTLTKDEAIKELFFNKVKTRKDIIKIGQFIRNMPNALGEDPFPLFHSFANGMYRREVHIPKGYIVEGKIHRDEYFIEVLKGRLLVMSEFGSKEIAAPCSFTAKSGVKHIVYTLDDTVWSDVSKTDKTTVEEAEKDIFADSYEELGIIEMDGYEEAIDELGLTDEMIFQMLTTDDLIKQPINDSIEVRESDIQGLGVFTTKDIKDGDRVALARLGDNRAPAGRYANHSDRPNAECIIDGNMILFFALKDLEKGAEVTVNYRNVRQAAISLDRSAA